MTGAERIAVLQTAYEAMDVERCCGEGPGVGVVGVLGFRFDDRSIYVESGPAEFTLGDAWGRVRTVAAAPPFYADGDVGYFFCEHSWYRLEVLEGGLAPIDAVDALAAALGCN